MSLKEAVADGVKKVRFALTGCSLEIERRKLRLFGSRHALRGVACQHIGFAGDEGLERQ